MICWGLGAFGLGLTGVLTLTSGAPVLPDAAVDLFGFSTASALGERPGIHDIDRLARGVGIDLVTGRMCSVTTSHSLKNAATTPRRVQASTSMCG
jgi:hypothetical protein